MQYPLSNTRFEALKSEVNRLESQKTLTEQEALFLDIAKRYTRSRNRVKGFSANEKKFLIAMVQIAQEHVKKERAMLKAKQAKDKIRSAEAKWLDHVKFTIGGITCSSLKRNETLKIRGYKLYLMSCLLQFDIDNLNQTLIKDEKGSIIYRETLENDVYQYVIDGAGTSFEVIRQHDKSYLELMPKGIHRHIINRLKLYGIYVK